MENIQQQIQIRMSILRVSVIESAQTQLAYVGNNWGNLASTTIFTISMLVFIEIIYANTSTFAGLTKGEFLLFKLISQLVFYIGWGIILPNLTKFIQSINTGSLDLILTKPLPTLFYINFKSVDIVSLVRDAAPPVLIVIAIIPWSELQFSSVSIFFGILTFFLGLIILLSYTTIITLPTIWLGEGENLFNLGMFFASDLSLELPISAAKEAFGLLFILILPLMICAGGTLVVLLDKDGAVIIFMLAMIFAAISSILRLKIWKYAIKNYTSASS